jgi:cytochrome c553
MYRNSKLLALARDKACVECGNQDGTVVSAHSNNGKGMGIKASDSTIMFLCYRCHAEYDQGKTMTKSEKIDFAYKNNAKTLQFLLEQGYLEISKKR